VTENDVLVLGAILVNPVQVLVIDDAEEVEREVELPLILPGLLDAVHFGNPASSGCPNLRFHCELLLFILLIFDNV